jgi:uroporphyrinogen decarboxylase
MRSAYRTTTRPATISEALWSSRFLKACRGEATDATPIWLMRQAGRYMAHYRERRNGRSFLDLCSDSPLAAEVTIYAQQWLGVDAAIIFSDILIVLQTLGMELTFTPGGGPSLPKPITSADDVAKLGCGAQAAADLQYVYDALRLTVAGLAKDIPCIGFAGAPFTLASYAIEGGGSRTFTRTKTFMYRETAAWNVLLTKIVDALIPYLNAQVAAGASALQLFDSWGGELSRADYDEYVLPHLQRLVAALPSTVPVIVFGTRTAHLIDRFAATGADVVGLDQGISIDEGWQRVGGPGRMSVQGNLDPALLLGSRERLLAQTDRVLADAAGRPGHIFNLGHGIIKETDPDNAKALVDHVHASSAR